MADSWTKEEVLEALREELAIWKKKAEKESQANGHHPSARYWEGLMAGTETAIERIEKIKEDAA